jgi:hypothetical protein
MRDSASQAITLQRQNDLLALQQLQLDAIQQNVSFGNAFITSQVTHRTSEGSVTRSLHNSIQRRDRQKKRDSFRLRLPLPQWLTRRTWAFTANQSQSSWTLEIHPVYRRPSKDVPVFNCIRNGDIAAFQRSIDAGELSQWDMVQYDSDYESTLLGVRAQHLSLLSELTNRSIVGSIPQPIRALPIPASQLRAFPKRRPNNPSSNDLRSLLGGFTCQ